MNAKSIRFSTRVETGNGEPELFRDVASRALWADGSLVRIEECSSSPDNDRLFRARFHLDDSVAIDLDAVGEICARAGLTVEGYGVRVSPRACRHGAIGPCGECTGAGRAPNAGAGEIEHAREPAYRVCMNCGRRFEVVWVAQYVCSQSCADAARFEELQASWATYTACPGAHTHGRCRSCAVLFAWPSAADRRIKDRPGCPYCGRDLWRTSLGNFGRQPEVHARQPLWWSEEDAETRRRLFAQTRRGS